MEICLLVRFTNTLSTYPLHVKYSFGMCKQALWKKWWTIEKKLRYKNVCYKKVIEIDRVEILLPIIAFSDIG